MPTPWVVWSFLRYSTRSSQVYPSFSGSSPDSFRWATLVYGRSAFVYQGRLQNCPAQELVSSRNGK